MLSRFLSVCAVAVAPFLSASAVSAEPQRQVALAYISDGRSFGLTRTVDVLPRHANNCHGTTIYLAHRPLLPLKKALAEGRVDEIHDFGDPTIPIRWRVSGGHLYESSFGHSSPMFRQISLGLLEAYWKSENPLLRTEGNTGLVLTSGLLEDVQWTAKPVEELMDDVEGDVRQETVEQSLKTAAISQIVNTRVCFDMLPGKKGEAKLFWTYKGQLHESSGTNRLVKDEYVTTWAAAVKSRVPFTGHFHVFACGKGYLFVTLTGAVYHMPEPDKNKGRAIARVADLKRDADLVLHDEASGKTFAFALPRKGKAGMEDGSYLELGSKEKVKTFPAKSVRALDPKKPIDCAHDCARLLLTDKRITGK